MIVTVYNAIYEYEEHIYIDPKDLIWIRPEPDRILHMDIIMMTLGISNGDNIEIPIFKTTPNTFGALMTSAKLIVRRFVSTKKSIMYPETLDAKGKKELESRGEVFDMFEMQSEAIKSHK